MAAGTRRSVAERRAAAEAALEAELRRIVGSGEYRRWFTAMASFHRYSPTNSMWILAQRPDATRVASYRTWAQLGRHVRKGETGIAVFHPRPFWVDPATGRKVPPPADDRDRARLVHKVAFGVGYVFDVAQTDGQPLPSLGRPAPDQAPSALAAQLHGYCDDHGITVEVQPLRDGLAGYYHRDRDQIVLSAAATPGERVATLAHELAHREDPELMAAHVAGDRRYYTHNRADCEAVAEAAAHVIAARFNHDLTASAGGYIASWIGGDVDRFKQLNRRVGAVTGQLVPPDHLDVVLTTAHHQAALSAGRRRSRPPR